MIVVSVSRDEDSAPPDIDVNDEGHRDFTKRTAWFGERPENFRAVAVKTVNRIVHFCKYELQVPNTLVSSAFTTVNSRIRKG